RALLRSPRGGADPQRLPARPREAPEHGAQPPLAFPPRAMHGAGAPNTPRRGDGLRRPTAARREEEIGTLNDSARPLPPAPRIVMPALGAGIHACREERTRGWPEQPRP